MRKKIFIFFLVVLILIITCNCVFAEESENKYSKKFIEWTNLSEEEKENTIAPLPFNVQKQKTSILDKAWAKIKATTIPSKYDLRDEINVKVRNQFQTGCCWAFAANSSVETYYLLHGREYDFSERHMEYNTASNFKDGTNPWTTDRTVGGGGYYCTPFTYYSRGSGPVLEEDMPFQNSESTIYLDDLPSEIAVNHIENMLYFPNIYKRYYNGTLIYEDANYYRYSDYEVQEIRQSIKEHIMKYGGIATNIYSTNNLAYFNSSKNAAYMNNSGLSPNHGVTIIGWDDNFSRYNFKSTPSRDGAYIILNSWGEVFGENGVYYISYDDFLVESQLRGITKASDMDYDNIYQHDINEMIENYESKYAANVFTSENDEELTEIMIGSCIDQTCNIYINTNVELNKTNKYNSLDINNLKKIKSDFKLKPGYTTLKLDEAIELSKGKKFAVIVEIDWKNQYFEGVGIESKNSYFPSTKSNPEESFYSSNGREWNDLYSSAYKNFSIKAFTKEKEKHIKIKQFAGKAYELNGGTYKVSLSSSYLADNKNVNIKIFHNNVDVTSKFSYEKNIIRGKGAYITIKSKAGNEAGAYIAYFEIEGIPGSTSKYFGISGESRVISLIKNPDKLTYNLGEELDLSGAILLQINTDGTYNQIEDISSKVIVTGYDKNKTGKQTVNISYLGISNTFEVNVIANEEESKIVIEKIEINKMPTKLEYIQNEENLDLSGGEIIITYSDGKTEIYDMTNEKVRYSGFDNTRVGTNTITIQYENFIVYLEITIKEKEDDDKEENEKDILTTNYLIKDEEWDISKNGDNSIIAKFTKKDKTIRINGSGVMKEWAINIEPEWKKYKGYLKKVIIEGNIDNIGNYAFNEFTELEKVEINCNLKKIGEYSFKGCTKLKKINLPDSISEIGKHGFEQCQQIDDLNLSDNITTIKEYTFCGCESLENIKISANLETIESNGFKDCYKLNNINFTDKLVKIEYFAFENCKSLEKIDINKNIYKIDNGAFRGCTKLKNIIVEAENEKFSSIDGVLFDKNGKRLHTFPGGKEDEYTIPDEIDEIALYAFYGAENIRKISMSDNITYISMYCFYNCINLQEISLSNQLTEIEVFSFYNCQNLKSIYLTDKIEKIGWYAFSGCKNLENVRLSNSLTQIEMYGFYECTSLKHINFPNSLRQIDVSVFENCTSIEKINLSSGISIIEERAFKKCENLSEINIPNTVKTIGAYAFTGCEKLNNIYIPSSVTKIEGNTFKDTILIVDENSYAQKYSEQNKKLYYLKSGKTISTAKYNIKSETWVVGQNRSGEIKASFDLNTRTLTISGKGPIATVNREDTYLKYNRFIKHAVVSEGITSIGGIVLESQLSKEHSAVNVVVINSEPVFSGLTELESVSLPNGITEIGSSEFSGCTKLKDINIPEGTLSIGSWCFRKCESLTEIRIPSSVKSIKTECFEECTSLENIKVDSECENYWDINGVLFQNMSYFESNGTHHEKYISLICCPVKNKTEILEIPSDTSSIEISAFRNCENIKSVIVPDGITDIKEFCFFECNSIENIKLPNTLKEIKKYAFYGCRKLNNVEIPNGVSKIGVAAFHDCETLEKIIIPDSVTVLESSTFANCTSLKSVTISKGISKINSQIFYKCTSLEEVNLPNTVTSLEGGIFSFCSSLKNIKLPNSLKEIKGASFSYCTNLNMIYIPESVTNIQVGSFGDSVMIYTTPNSGGQKYGEEAKHLYIIIDGENEVKVNFEQNKEAQTIVENNSIKVNVESIEEEIGIKDGSLKYLWSRENKKPEKEEFKNEFENGDSILRERESGVWYLWIYAEDNFGNDIITVSEPYTFNETLRLIEKIELITPTKTKYIKQEEKIDLTDGKLKIYYDDETIEEIDLENDLIKVSGYDLNKTGIQTVVIEYQGKIVSYEITVENKEITSDKYYIDKDKNMIKKILSATKITEFINNINLDCEYSILENGLDVTNDEDLMIKTGQILVVENKQYTLIVNGDINGDGKVTASDLSLLRRVIIGVKKLENAFKEAGDLNEDGQIKGSDLSKLKRKVIGITE